MIGISINMGKCDYRIIQFMSKSTIENNKVIFIRINTIAGMQKYYLIPKTYYSKTNKTPRIWEKCNSLIYFNIKVSVRGQFDD